MKIEIVVDPRKAPTPLSARVSSAPSVARGGGVRGGRGRGRGRGGPGGRRQDERPKKTVEDLDAEMEVWNILVVNFPFKLLRILLNVGLQPSRTSIRSFFVTDSL
ncbi:hypothetical protein M422DRAFT_232249 [Sphaerobolus stellatus SS14]|uniref:Chromatin target of PRMT1 protein C-terminal domain-containing protein n=1 Tax=Sphaerobolus stellatus (strain SS14) TaxID=990650 RepID=A0A0C9VH56_SPHS4|nr:hypothetical protein M422DRAFT_232249 [Sphaerobolus stellatus SS14]